MTTSKTLIQDNEEETISDKARAMAEEVAQGDEASPFYN